MNVIFGLENTHTFPQIFYRYFTHITLNSTNNLLIDYEAYQKYKNNRFISSININKISRLEKIIPARRIRQKIIKIAGLIKTAIAIYVVIDK